MALLAAWVLSPLAAGAGRNAQTPAGPRVAVSPVGDLHDQRDVRVSLSGFGPDDRVHLSECPAASDVAVAGCGRQVAQQPFLDLEHDGTGTTTFVVRDFASTGLGPTPTTGCTTSCVLLAVGGSGLAYAPLRFAGPLTLPVTGAPVGLATAVGALSSRVLTPPTARRCPGGARHRRGCGCGSPPSRSGFGGRAG